MQSPPRYTPCNGLMYETDFGNYVSHQDYLLLKRNLDSILTECRKLVEENKGLKELREGDFHLTKSLAEALNIKITASDKSRGTQWGQFHDGCLALFKDRNDLKWAWNNDTILIKSLAKTLGIEITAPDSDTVLQWEQFSQGCISLKKQLEEKLKVINENKDLKEQLKKAKESFLEQTLKYQDNVDKLKREHQKEIESFIKFPFECDKEIETHDSYYDAQSENMSCPGVKISHNVEPSFQDKLKNLINYHSKENGSDTPDFILAQFLCDSLESWNKNINRRGEWYGKQSNSVKIPE